MPLDYAPSHIRNKPRLPKNVCYEFKEDAFRGTRSRVANIALVIRVVLVGQRGHGQCNKTGWVDTGLYNNAQLLSRFLGIGGNLNAVYLKRPVRRGQRLSSRGTFRVVITQIWIQI